MKVVIDISEEDYKRGIVLASTIRNGIPLPEDYEILIEEAYADLRGLCKFMWESKEQR